MPGPRRHIQLAMSAAFLITSAPCAAPGTPAVAPTAGPKPSGYVVLVRETSAPQWQQRFPVSGLTADFPISKDNFIFGVVSVDAAGHESVAVLPVVGR